MDSKQKHEMNLLMAKKSWDMETHAFDTLLRKYDATVSDVASAEKGLEKYLLGDLVKASDADGAMPGQTSTVVDNNDIRVHELKQTELNTLKEELRLQEDKLATRVMLNEYAKMGEGFSKRMTSLPSAKDQKEYDVLAESDGVPGLSYKEKQKALNMYIKDTGLVLNEGDKDYDTGINQKIWDGAKYEDLKVIWV